MPTPRKGANQKERLSPGPHDHLPHESPFIFMGHVTIHCRGRSPWFAKKRKALLYINPKSGVVPNRRGRPRKAFHRKLLPFRPQMAAPTAAARFAPAPRRVQCWNRRAKCTP